MSVLCKQCGAECGIAPGIGPICTSPDCDAVDGCGLTKEEAENRKRPKMSLKLKYKHIEFMELGGAKKTKIFACGNPKANVFLGVVKWDCSWRQYTFFPEPKLKFSKSCMDDIGDFIKQLMDERKK